MDKIKLFFEETEEEVTFVILSSISYKENTYHMVVEEGDEDSDEEDMTAYILREVMLDNEELTYEIVDDDDELDPVVTIFEQTLDNYELDME